MVLWNVSCYFLGMWVEAVRLIRSCNIYTHAVSNWMWLSVRLHEYQSYSQAIQKVLWSGRKYLYQKVSVSLQYLHCISWFWIINLVLQPHIQLWPDLAPNSQNVKAIMNQGTIMAASVFCNYVIFWLWVPKHSHKTSIML